MPEPGAARIYVSDEEWKEVVRLGMQAARLVIIRAGGGENLLWELRQAMETLKPEKLLILALGMNVKDDQSFRTKADLLLNVSLPEGAGTMQRFDQVSGFIGFAADWKPSFFPLQAPYFRTSLFKPYRSLFMFALKPVFARFGHRMAASSGFGCEAASVRATRSPHGDGRTQLGVKPSQNRIALSIVGALLGVAIGSVVRIARRRDLNWSNG